MRNFIISSAALFVLVARVSSYQFDNKTEGPAYPVILPAPRQIDFGNDTLTMDPCRFRVSSQAHESYDKEAKDFVQKSIEQFVQKYIFIKGPCIKQSPPQESDLKELVILIKGNLPSNGRMLPDKLQDTIESYKLTLTTEGALIEAFQYSGVVRALNTFAQLVRTPKIQDLAYTLKFAPIHITDEPRYPYRGMMLDTARRYYSVESIL